MAAAAIALIATVYVFYVTVFEQIISQNQGYFYAVIFGFILLILFLLCNLFTKLIAISGGGQRSSYRRLVILIGLIVIAGLFLVTRMRYSTLLSPQEFPVYRGAVAMAEGMYSQSLDLVESACANPGQYLYSFILSIIFRFTGPGVKPFLWTNAFFIVLCGFLTYKIVTTFTNQMCGLFAAILCAFVPSQTFAVYSFTSEPMVAAIFLGAVLALISLYSYNKRVKEMDDYGDEGDRNLAGIIFTIVGALLIGLLLFVEPFMIIPVILLVVAAFFGRNDKALHILLAFAAGLVLFFLLCFVKSIHMNVDFGKVMKGEISAFDPMTDYNSGQVSEFGDVYHSFNVELSSTDRNITGNYVFITDGSGAGAYSEMSASWVVVLNQIMYMFVLMMSISCMILAVKEQKDYVVTISILIIGAFLMLFFQQNRDDQQFLFITVFIIASSTGIHYLYLDHHPELKVSINALDALEKTGRKEMAAATRSNLINAAQMTEADFVRRAKALIFVGNDEDLYMQIKNQEHEMSGKGYKRPERAALEESFDDYDEDFFLDKEDDAGAVSVTTVAPSGIRQTSGGDELYQPNAEMHEAANDAYNNSNIPAWKRPEKFGDDEMFDEDEPDIDKAHSEFDGRDALMASEGLTTGDPAPVVEKIKRNTKRLDIKPSKETAAPAKDSVSDSGSLLDEHEEELLKRAIADAEKISTPIAEEETIEPENVKSGRFKKEKIKKEKVKKEKTRKEKSTGQLQTVAASSGTAAGGRAVRRIKTVGSSSAQTVSIPADAAVKHPVNTSVPVSEEPAPSQPLPNPLPVPKKKAHKAMDYDQKPKAKNEDDWDFDYDTGADDDWDV